MSTSALIRERGRLEARLLEVQLALEANGVAEHSSSICPCVNDALSFSNGLGQAVGLRAEMVRLVALLVLIAVVWVRGRSAARSLSIMAVAMTINVWASARRLRKWARSQLATPAPAGNSRASTAAPITTTGTRTNAALGRPYVIK